MRRNALIAAAVVVLYLLPLELDTLRLRVAIEILYFGLFAVSFNLLFGYAGMLSFGYAATFGVGGYAVGLIWKHLGAVPVPLALLGGALAGSVVGLLIGFFCVRLRGTYFSLLTLAFSQFLFAVALKWRDVTRGDDGLTVTPPDLTLPGGVVLHMGNAPHFYWLELTVVLFCLWLAWRFIRTPLGNAALLMRENDERAAFLGYNVFGTKLIIFTFASTLAAIAGALFATFQRLISPGALDLGTGTEVVFMTLFGGTGTLLGPFLGTAAYILLQNWLARNTEHWPFVIGFLFVVMILFMHTGLVGLLGRSGPVQRLFRLRRTPVEESL
jgi:branched-chain amino acid transport system permease protein